MKVILSTLALVFFVPLIAAAESYYFLEKDGPNKSIAYKASCFKTMSGKSASCTLKAIITSNSKASLKCTLSTQTLFSDQEATIAGESYIVPVTAGACGYTNTYQISKAGLVQTKSSPSKKKLDVCSVFKPKVYNIGAVASESKLVLPVGGCNNLIVSGLD